MLDSRVDRLGCVEIAAILTFYIWRTFADDAFGEINDTV